MLRRYFVRLPLAHHTRRPFCTPKEPPPPIKAHLSVRELIQSYGLPLAVYYFVFNESCVAVLTLGMHYGWFGGSDVLSVLNYIGLGAYVDLGKVEASCLNVGPICISAKFMTNFGLASAFMALWTPLQVPFCIATLPFLKRLFRRGPPIATA